MENLGQVGVATVGHDAAGCIGPTMKAAEAWFQACTKAVTRAGIAGNVGHRFKQVKIALRVFLELRCKNGGWHTQCRCCIAAAPEWIKVQRAVPTKPGQLAMSGMSVFFVKSGP